MQAAGQGQDRNSHPADGRPALLIVDSLSFLVSPVMGPGSSEDGHALMICLGRALKALAQTHMLAVITTNHIVGGTATLRSDMAADCAFPCLTYTFPEKMFSGPCTYPLGTA